MFSVPAPQRIVNSLIACSGGWIVTYIIDERHGSSNSGYISSGYWGGLTIGRIALLWVNKKVCADFWSSHSRRRDKAWAGW